MKTIDLHDITQALKQASPQQRNVAAQNHGALVGALANSYNAQENNLRQKLNTPPPPQGTVMDEYQQYLAQMGLAQPGLEEYAQQMAAGGLVAFNGGGLASALDTGYADDSGMPYFNIDGGHDYEQGYAGGGEVDLLTPDRIELLKRLRAMQGSDFKLEMDVPEKAPVSEAPEVYDRRPKTADEYLAESPLGSKPHFLAYPDDVAPDITPPSPAPEDDTHKRSVKEKHDNARAAQEAKEAEHPEPKNMGGVPVDPNTGKPKKVSNSPAAQPAVSAPTRDTIAITTDEDAEDGPRYNLPPEAREIATRVVNSDLSSEKQVAVLEQMLQVNTSTAAEIKARMEKDAAHASNTNIMAALVNAIGMGLGTYGNSAHRWGSALTGLSSGLVGAAKDDEERQAQIDKMAMQIDASQQAPHAKAVEMVMSAKQKAAEEAAQNRRAFATAQLGYQGKVDAQTLANQGRMATERLRQNQAPKTQEMTTAQQLSEERRLADLYMNNPLTFGEMTTEEALAKARQSIAQRLGAGPMQSMGRPTYQFDLAGNRVGG